MEYCSRTIADNSTFGGRGDFANESQEVPKEGFSVTALKSADTNDYTILIETMDAKEGQSVTFRVAGGLSTSDLAVWRSRFGQEALLRLDDIVPRDGELTIRLEPNSMYSLTGIGTVLASAELYTP